MARKITLLASMALLGLVATAHAQAVAAPKATAPAATTAAAAPKTAAAKPGMLPMLGTPAAATPLTAAAPKAGTVATPAAAAPKAGVAAPKAGVAATKGAAAAAAAAPPTPPLVPVPAVQGPLKSITPFSCPDGVTAKAGTATRVGAMVCKPVDSTARSTAMFALRRLNAQKVLPNSPVKLDKVTKYATQVVAGINYFIEMTVKDAKGAPSTLQVQVFQELSSMGGKKALTGYVKV